VTTIRSKSSGASSSKLRTGSPRNRSPRWRSKTVLSS
jgi:hypothetical protein